jgi:hypothetical protein
MFYLDNGRNEDTMAESVNGALVDTYLPLHLHRPLSNHINYIPAMGFNPT